MSDDGTNFNLVLPTQQVRVQKLGDSQISEFYPEQSKAPVDTKESMMTKSHYKSTLRVQQTMTQINATLRFLHDDHKATARQANAIRKITKREFLKYDLDNISDEKKLINDLKTVCDKFAVDSDDEDQK